MAGRARVSAARYSRGVFSIVDPCEGVPSGCCVDAESEELAEHLGWQRRRILSAVLRPSRTETPIRFKRLARARGCIGWSASPPGNSQR